MGRRKRDYGDFIGKPEVEKYLDGLKGEGKSEHTLHAYRVELIKFLQTVEKSPRNLTVSDVLSYRDNLHTPGPATKRSKPATIRSNLQAIKQFLRVVCSWSEDDLKKVKLPKLDHRLPVYLSEQEAARLLDAAQYNVRDYAILTIMLYGGLRLSEVVNLDISDIDFEQNIILIRLGKGSKDRIVPLNKVVRDAVLEYLKYRADNNINPKDGSKVLFVGHISNRVSPSAIHNMVKLYTLRANVGKHISAHKLRHTCLTHLYRRSGDIRFVQAVAGHSQLSTTLIYTHVDSDHIRAVYDKANLDFGRQQNIPYPEPVYKKSVLPSKHQYEDSLKGYG